MPGPNPAWLLDGTIPPPSCYRIRLDGVTGLVPGLGNVVDALLSSCIVVETRRLRIPASVLLALTIGLVALVAAGRFG